MSKLLSIFAVLALTFSAHAQIASDNASNYSGGWTNGSNGGSGFGAWTITSSGTAGVYVGNPSSIGIGGMPSSSFGLYANVGAGNFVNATRSLIAPLGIGETFSFLWGINFDGNNSINGNKGFDLLVGATTVVTVNNGGTDAIQFNTQDVGFGYGTNAMTWSFTLTDATTLAVSANDRDGSGTFSTNITVSGGVSSFNLYASQLNNGSQGEPFYNNFQVVPEPTTVTLALVGLAGLAIARRRKQ